MSRQTIDPHRRRQRVGSHSLMGVTLALALALAPSVAIARTPEPASLQDCNAAEPTRVLRKTFEGAWEPVRQVKAVWLDGRRLLWPGQTATGEYQLHHVGEGYPGIFGRIRGDRVLGVPLRVARGDRAKVPPEFTWLGPGLVLEVPEDYSHHQVRAWHRWPLQVESWGLPRKDRAVVATGIQIGAALDDLFARAAVERAPLGVDSYV